MDLIKYMKELFFENSNPVKLRDEITVELLVGTPTLASRKFISTIINYR